MVQIPIKHSSLHNKGLLCMHIWITWICTLFRVTVLNLSYLLFFVFRFPACLFDCLLPIWNFEFSTPSGRHLSQSIEVTLYDLKIASVSIFLPNLGCSWKYPCCVRGTRTYSISVVCCTISGWIPGHFEKFWVARKTNIASISWGCRSDTTCWFIATEPPYWKTWMTWARAFVFPCI